MHIFKITKVQDSVNTDYMRYVANLEYIHNNDLKSPN